MDAVWQMMELRELGVLRARGVDAVRFLQGQLSSDVARLSAQRAQLSGYHNPQGRAIALLRLIQFDSDDILAVLPRELAADTAARLAKFVLRSKVKLSDDSNNWRIRGLLATGTSPPAPAVGPEEHAQLRAGDAVYVRLAGQRLLLVAPAGATDPDIPAVPGDRHAWDLADIAGGQPQVLGATSQEFVAQMLNLDVLGAVAFDKGCYTGQEVIARAHYRGRVKRRMQRFVSRDDCELAPGDSGRLSDGRTFKVVLAAPLPDGRCEFLAVAALPAADAAETLSGPVAGSEHSAPVVNERAVPADQLALPYALPE